MSIYTFQCPLEIETMKERLQSCMTRKSLLMAAERNKGPIAEVLKQYIPLTSASHWLEFASGWGTHARFLTHHFPHLHWTPSDVDPVAVSNLTTAFKGARNIAHPLFIDVSKPISSWNGSAGSWDGILCVNMIHISSNAAVEGLFKNSALLLRPQGRLVVYGPFAFHGHISPQSNADFDQSLRSRNPEWGLRDLDFLKGLAERNGLAYERTHEMPANNHILVFCKG